jgi:hypothetical protein
MRKIVMTVSALLWTVAASTRAVGIDEGIVGMWLFDDKGKEATDASGNGNVGTLDGGASWTTGKSAARC